MASEHEFFGIEWECEAFAGEPATFYDPPQPAESYAYAKSVADRKLAVEMVLETLDSIMEGGYDDDTCDRIEAAAARMTDRHLIAFAEKHWADDAADDYVTACENNW
jgi:hypothetical protein